MAQVTYNSIKKFRFYGNEDTTETNHTQENSLRDNLIKKIVSNQLNKHLGLEECVISKEKFVVSSKQNFSNSCEGLISNELYKKLCEEKNVKEILSCSGLNSNEIDILLGEAKSGNSTEEAYLQRLKDIEEKLEQREESLQNTSKEHFSKALKLNRHEYEEEFSKGCSETAEKLSCLFKLEPYKDASLPLEHPINNLLDLEKQLFPNTNHASICKQKFEENSKPQIKYYHKRPKTLWDMEERPLLLPDSDCESSKILSFTSLASTTSNTTTNNNNKRKKKKTKKCHAITINNNNNAVTTDFSRPFVWTLKQSELLSIAEILNNRLSVEEIKSNNKFTNYFPGSPSSILYIKNLPLDVDPLKIVSLFGNFEEENESKIEYRVLKGKMKGQAFVTFKNSEVSEKALRFCNGFLMGDKPIVIEYARGNL